MIEITPILRRSRKGELEAWRAKNCLPPMTKGTYAHYKEPLTEIPSGYGYFGAIMEAKEGKYIQCHVCGWYFQFLGIHVRAFHGMSAKEYRETFGLARGTSLCSPAMKAALSMREEGRKFEESPEVTRKKREILEKYRGKNRTGKSIPHPLEVKNIRGRCPDQLIDKIQKLAKKLGHTPSYKDFIKEYAINVKTVKNEFGSWSKAIEKAGLPANKFAHTRFKK